MLSLPRSTVGLALTSKGILCSLTACLRNMLIACVVLMPSSEKSLAASPLVCLSIRTVTSPADLPASCVCNTAIVRALALSGYFGVTPPLRSAGTEAPTPTITTSRFTRIRKSAGGTLDKAQVDKLMAFLRDLGIHNWFSSYYSPALDGEQWRLFDGHRSREGV